MAKTVSAGFVELLGRLALTDQQEFTASTRATGIKDFLAANLTMAERALTIGSYRRGTLIRPERDIDILAPLSYSTYKSSYDNDSRGLLYYVRDKLKAGYSTTRVSSREVAILLDFTVIRADVVPAFKRSGGGYFIPNGKSGWQATNPDYHTRVISEADDALDNRLKPLIRLMKFWNHANGHHLRSFHVELMVWRMWKDLTSLPAYSHAVAQSLGAMSGWLRGAFPDPWDGGGPVDGYLSLDTRAMVRRMLDQDAKAASEAEDYRKAEKTEKAFERWGVVFRHEFPAYG
jgi:hypothetical protein